MQTTEGTTITYIRSHQASCQGTATSNRSHWQEEARKQGTCDMSQAGMGHPNPHMFPKACIAA